MKRLVIIDQMETCLAMAVHQFPLEKKTLENGHIECTSKQSLRKVRLVENPAIEKSYSNKRIERVDCRGKRERINGNEHNNGGGSQKSSPLDRGGNIWIDWKKKEKNGFLFQ